MNTIMKSITALFFLLAFAGGGIVQGIIVSKQQLAETFTETSSNQQKEDSLKENEIARDIHHAFDILLAGCLASENDLQCPTVMHGVLSAFDAVFSPPPNRYLS